MPRWTTELVDAIDRWELEGPAPFVSGPDPETGRWWVTIPGWSKNRHPTEAQALDRCNGQFRLLRQVLENAPGVREVHER